MHDRCAYQLLVIALFGVDFIMGLLPSSKADILEDVMTHCAIGPTHRVLYRIALIYYSCALPLLFISALCFKLSNGSIQAVVPATSTRYLYIRSRFGVLHWHLLVVTGWIGGIIYFMVKIELIRQERQKASGPLDQSSRWGFGQVVAVASWAPVLHEISVKVISGFIRPITIAWRLTEASELLKRPTDQGTSSDTDLQSIFPADRRSSLHSDTQDVSTSPNGSQTLLPATSAHSTGLGLEPPERRVTWPWNTSGTYLP